MLKVKDKYVNGEFVSRSETFIPEEVCEPIGELINSPTFNDMIYPDNMSEAMKLMINKAKTENVNILFYGDAGTGKTTSAKMIAVETKRHFVYLTGSMGRNKIVQMLLNSKDNSIILIDEIHNLPEKIGEIIYPAIQDNEIYLDGEKKKLNLMFIGTTTEPQELPKPLLARFKLIEFNEPDEEMMKKILLKRCSEEVINPLLNHTLNIRIINNLLDMMKMYGEINKENLIKVFRLKKINIYSGLSDLQDKYLAILKRASKPIGLRSLGLQLRKSEDYIKYEIESDLIRKDFVIITSRGREINPEFKDYGYEQLKKEGDKSHTEKTMTEIELAEEYLKSNPEIKNKFGKRYLELVNFIAQKIVEGVSPECIDWESFGNDCPISESFKNNYLEEL